MAFDDRLYEKETARAMLGSFVSRLKQCARQPAAAVALPPALEGPTDGEVYLAYHQSYLTNQF